MIVVPTAPIAVGLWIGWLAVGFGELVPVTVW